MQKNALTKVALQFVLYLNFKITFYDFDIGLKL